jgi:hypothetical protein
MHARWIAPSVRELLVVIAVGGGVAEVGDPIAWSVKTVLRAIGGTDGAEVGPDVSLNTIHHMQRDTKAATVFEDLLAVDDVKVIVVAGEGIHSVCSADGKRNGTAS